MGSGTAPKAVASAAVLGSSVSSPSAQPPPSAAAVNNPVTLASLDVSAYGASVVLQGHVVHLLTQEALFRFAPGEAAQRRPLQAGQGATLMDDAVVYWADGAIWKLPLAKGEPQRLGAARNPPQYFVGERDELAWLERSSAGRFTIRTLEGRIPAELYSSPGHVDAMTLVGDAVFFVERPAAGRWRLGRVATVGGPPTFGSPREGRAPSMLESWQEHIYYYDGNALEVRRVPLDLHGEEVMVRDSICSPIAVSERIYCGHVQGLYEILGKGGSPQLMTRNERGYITAITAGPRGVAWVSDAGRDQLGVSMITRD